jgi:prepilin-type N-terminal cleavage/methylation domain-containing protein
MSTKSLNELKTVKMSFTLMELLIVIALLAIIAAAAIVFLNPLQQVKKSLDAKRKSELNQLKKVLEDWYNDKNCYPQPAQICYNPPTQLSDQTYVCDICGNETLSPSFSPYLPKLPCDPEHPNRSYLYQVNDLNCPSYYRIYTRFSNHTDPGVKESGCLYFCGPISNPFGFDYGATSPNTKLEDNISRTIYYCQDIGNCTFINQDRLPNQIHICNPSFGDSNCGGTNCQTKSTCIYQTL